MNRGGHLEWISANVLQTARVYWRVPVLFNINCSFSHTAPFKCSLNTEETYDANSGSCFLTPTVGNYHTIINTRYDTDVKQLLLVCFKFDFLMWCPKQWHYFFIFEGIINLHCFLSYFFCCFCVVSCLFVSHIFYPSHGVPPTKSYLHIYISK